MTFKEDVEKKVAEIERLVKAKDFSSLQKHYVENAAIFPPDGEYITGRDNVTAYIQKNWGGMDTSQFDSKTEDISGDDNWAVVRGRYTLNDKSGKPLEKGSFVTVFKKCPTSKEFAVFVDSWGSSKC